MLEGTRERLRIQLHAIRADVRGPSNRRLFRINKDADADAVRGQLDEEMTRHGWFNTAGDTGLLFDIDAEQRWAKAFAAAGIDPRLLANSAGLA